jgi:hypothetical protein
MESSYNVAGSTLFIGNLSAASVSPKMFGSAMRTSVQVSVTIRNTFQASAYIIVRFPADFEVNDGAPTIVTLTWLTRYTSQYSTPSHVVATDQATRSVTISIGGRDDDMLEAMKIFVLTLTNIRNMVARPPHDLNYEVSGTFFVVIRLQGGMIVETLNVPGTQFTCFISTKVQKLTPEELRARCEYLTEQDLGIPDRRC